MPSTLKWTALVVLGLIVLQVAVLGTAAAQQMDPPGLPHQFYGTVTIDRAAAPDGTRVTAEVNGVEAKASSTREGKYGYDTGDLFRVDGAVGAAGDEVVFKVNGVAAEEAGVFKNGGSTELNLSATQTAGDPLIDRYDTNGNGTIEKNEVIKAINDYLFGEGDEAISKAEVIKLINLYLFGPS